MTEEAGRRRATSPADVDRRFDELWREASTDGQAVVRACSMNLVVVCDEDDVDLERSTAQVRQIAETLPGRSLVVGPPREDAAGEFEVYVTGHCHRGRGGAQICSEQVSIHPTLGTLDRVRPTILQLLVEDMPVSTWWRRRELDLETLVEPLLRLSDCLIVDSTQAAQPQDYLARLGALGHRTGWRKGRLADLAWVRLEPWRDAIASFFDGPSLRGALAGIERVRIAARGVTGAYLAGWLASRLGLRRDDGNWIRHNGRPVEIVFASGQSVPAGEVHSVTIEAVQGDDRLVLDATRDGAEGLRLTVRSKAHEWPARLVRLPDDDEAALLCGVLQRSGSEKIYRQALRDAALSRAAG